MIIRKANIQDKEQIISLMDGFNNYYYDEKIFSEDFLPFWEYKDKQKIFKETAQEWLTDSSFFVFLAEEKNVLIGYIVGYVKKREPRVLDKEGYINDWFVSKGYRNKGVG